MDIRTKYIVRGDEEMESIKKHITIIVITVLLASLVSCGYKEAMSLDKHEAGVSQNEFESQLENEVQMILDGEIDHLSREVWEKSDGYPIKKGSKLFGKLCKDLKRRYKAFDMPEDYLKSKNTEELMEYALSHPVLYQVGWNHSNDGFDAALEISNIFIEFYNRADSDQVLYDEYNRLSELLYNNVDIDTNDLNKIHGPAFDRFSKIYQYFYWEKDELPETMKKEIQSIWEEKVGRFDNYNGM